MSAHSVFLARFLGLYVLILSSVFLLKRKSFSRFAREFADHEHSRYLIAMVELAGGLAIVLTHNIWTFGYQGVITVIGWLMVVESIFHLLASNRQEAEAIEKLDNEYIWLAMGAISVVAGIYLVASGFGFA